MSDKEQRAAELRAQFDADRLALKQRYENEKLALIQRYEAAKEDL